jgi:hypothetical protein
MSNKVLRVFKLITGEEIIAEVVSTTETTYAYDIKNVLMLMMQQSQDGRFGISIVPWGAHSNDPVTINEEHIIYSAEPKKELVELYEKAFSPLALPQKSLITG